MLKYVEKKITEFTESDNYTGIFLKQLCPMKHDGKWIDGTVLLKANLIFIQVLNVHIRQKLNVIIRMTGKKCMRMNVIYKDIKIVIVEENILKCREKDEQFIKDEEYLKNCSDMHKFKNDKSWFRYPEKIEKLNNRMQNTEDLLTNVISDFKKFEDFKFDFEKIKKDFE